MQEQTLDGHMGRTVTIDVCLPCQSFWFDSHESVQLSPGGTLALFRVIGEHIGKRSFSNADLAKCPRCHGRLRLTQDMQRATRFSYLRCPNDHGRLTTFFDFLREKDFIRPLTAEQLRELRENVQTINCSNCGAPVDVAHHSACSHCGSPLSMLDLHQAETLVAQLRKAEAREHQPIDPMLPLNLLRARREVEAAFPHDRGTDWTPTDLVEAGVQALASWLKRNA
jgi:Zn finger protein HypA/HybF involved in hydrogenase expression